MPENPYRSPFYRPPATEIPPPHEVTSNHIMLYKDAKWSGEALDLDLRNYYFDRVFTFSGTPMNDEATWIAFNLPRGTICTLFEHFIPNKDGSEFCFAHAGRCVELIGTGKTESVDLIAFGANDCLSSGRWRSNPDMSGGWVQLFKGANCSGLFNTIFLADWVTGVAHSLADWHISKPSSINYNGLTPPQVLTLATNIDGSGEQISVAAANAFGAWEQELPADDINFSISRMQNKIQSFKASIIMPVKATIRSVSKTFEVPVAPGETIPQLIDHRNGSSERQKYKVTCFTGRKYSLAGTTTLQYTMSVALSSSVTVTAGVDGAKASGMFTALFEASVSKSITRQQTSEQTIEFQQDITFNVPPAAHLTGEVSVTKARFPQTLSAETQGEFFYNQNLPGSTWSHDDQLFRLETPVTISLNGEFSTELSFKAESKPLSLSQA
jgi:hypothetical protein